VRYADDFIITGNSKEWLEHEIMPVVVDFLKERGMISLLCEISVLGVGGSSKQSYTRDPRNAVCNEVTRTDRQTDRERKRKRERERERRERTTGHVPPHSLSVLYPTRKTLEETATLSRAL